MVAKWSFSFFIFIVIFFIPGCLHIVHKGPPVSTGKLLGKSTDLDDSIDVQFVQEQEAKLMDVPIPLNAKPVSSYFKNDFSENGCSLGYKIGASICEILLFYTQEMEKLGWEKTISIQAAETLLCFEKPSRVCIISLRPVFKKDGKDSVLFLIFTGKR